MGKTLILIDGHALAFRQYYALERTNMQTSDGTPTWAVYGFFKAIFDLLKNPDLSPDAIAVAFDVSHRTFRTEKYEDYKCNREAMPVPMKSQMDLINEGLEAFGIPVYTKEGYEADDVIGTISKEACELGHKVLILTGDQDAFQLIDKEGCVKVILPSKGELIEYDWDKVHEKLGVYPNQVIDYKALRGDVSDCIPGIKGIGEKTAQKLLAEHYTLEEVLSHSSQITQKSLREKLENGVEQAKLSQYLATIVRDLDVNFDFEKTKVELPDISAVTAFLKNMQFYSFIKNIDEILYSFKKDGEKPNILSKNETTLSPQAPAGGQLGLFTHAIQAEINKNDDIKYSKKLVTDSFDFENLCSALKNKTCIAFEIEAEVLSPVKSIITGINIGFSDKMTAKDNVKFTDEELEIKTFYIPLTHSMLTKQLAYKDVIDELKNIIEDENIKKITFDLKRQYNILRNNNIDLKGCIFDIMLASYVKDSARNHDLEIQAMERIDHSVIPFAPYEKDKKKRISLKDAAHDNILEYTADRISTIINLTKFWISSLDEEELKIVYNIEVPLSVVLADMEFNGVSIDTAYLNSLSESMTQKLVVLEKKIFEIAEESFNINSPRQVADILFNKLGYKGKKKRGKNQNSTSAEVLETLAEEYEIARFILEYRKYAKLKSTYTDALPALVDTVDKRIHTTYNQTVTTTGRLSSSNPNLQNIPTRTEEGNQIRKAFVPQDRENYLILSADYSQIELRLLAHISGDTHLIKAFNSGKDVHTITASKVFEVPIENVTKEMRYKSKAVNFGIIYGQSKYGLAKALGITKEQAEDFINKYFKTYPMVKAYMEATIMDAEKNGYVKTIFGRKRDLSKELNSSNAMVREFAKRAAINHPMQGTAADLMKIAMISFEKNLKENKLNSKMIMQVHDELVVEVKKDELELVKKLVLEAMELNQPFDVPLVVDVNVGETWEE